MEANRIYNMDCLQGMREMEPDSIDAIITDPPYNTGMSGMVEEESVHTTTRLKYFFNDSYGKDEYLALAEDTCKELYRLLKPDHGGVIFINYKSLGIWLNALERAGFSPKNAIVWDKVMHGLNYRNYAYTYELIIFFVKGNFWPNNKTPNDMRHKYYTDIWRIKRDISILEGKHHETIKPQTVLDICIRHITKAGDLVIDPFAGSGSVPVALLENGRRYIGFEKEPEYYKTAEERIRSYHKQSKLS